jgi:type II secretory pathway component GspD/PulD (secretin)/Tfp pilus assembly protein PilF
MQSRKFLLLIIFFALYFLSCAGPPPKPVVSLKNRLPPAEELLGTIVIIETIVTASVSAGLSNLPFVHFAIVTNQSDIRLTALKFGQTGSIKDSDIKMVKLYLDNGDDIFDAVKDISISSSRVKDGICEFKIDYPIINKPQLFFVTLDLASQATGTISLVFTEDSFETTDIIDITHKSLFPFTASSSISEAPPEVLLPPEKPEKIPLKPQPLPIPKPIPVPKVIKPEPTTPSEIISELEKEKTIKMQENEFIAQKYYEMGLKLFKEFNYHQAKEKLEKALELNPHHQEARRLLQEIQMLLGSRAEEIKVVKEFLESQLAVKIQETEIVVRNHYLTGERLLSEKKYQEALIEFEAIEAKLKWIPYDIGLQDYLNKAKDKIKQVKNLAVKHEEDVMRQRREAATLVAQEEELKRHQEFNEKIKSLFREALVFFEQKRYEEVERVCNTILQLTPQFYLAGELKKEAIRARHYKVSADYIQRRSENLRALYDDFKETLIPYADDKMVRYDPKVWEVASKRTTPGIIVSKLEEDPDILEIKRKLKGIKYDFRLEDVSLFEVVSDIQQRYRIAIVFDPDVTQEGTPSERKSFTLIGLPLDVGLRNLLEMYDLTYTFHSEYKCVWITKMGKLEEELEWRVHNVEDLVREIPEFSGPNIELPLSPGGQASWVPPTAEMPAVPPIPIEEEGGIIDMIKKYTGKDKRGQSTWESPGVSIKRVGESYKILVVHTSSTQEEIIEFLQILRSFRTAMVAMEATFISITDDFLEILGIELRDIPRVPIPNQPEIPRQPQPTAGLLPGGNRDIRFRTAYSFRNAIGNIEASLPPSAVGGLGMQFSVLGKPRVNMLLSALEKTGKGTILDSPKIIALNGQRVNVSFLKQRQYVQDGDIQGGAVAYEPVVNIFSTGIVLDVKPVMSYDRKFITVHVFPTLIELMGLRTRRLEFSATPPGVGLPVYTFIDIELPWLRLQRARTSAVVPDGGAVVLGGMKTVYDRTISSSTPLLDKIPVLQVFFRRRIQGEEKRSQLIIISAEIIELPEIEETVQ